MPIITIAMYSGRTQRDKDRLAEAITEDVVNILKVDKKDVVIVFQEASHGKLVCFWYPSLIMSHLIFSSKPEIAYRSNLILDV